MLNDYDYYTCSSVQTFIHEVSFTGIYIDIFANCIDSGRTVPTFSLCPKQSRIVKVADVPTVSKKSYSFLESYYIIVNFPGRTSSKNSCITATCVVK